MGKILTGYINLSKIPKDLITTSKKGEKILDISISEMRAPSQYGDTHSISVWGSGRGRVYIGNLKIKDLDAPGAHVQEVQASKPAPPSNSAEAATAAQTDEDLPF